VIGLVMMSQASAPIEMHLAAGVLIGLALSGVTNAVVLGAVGRRVPESWRPLAFGIVSAGGSLGQFLMVPAGQALIAGAGWQTALLWLALISTSMALMGLFFTRRSGMAAQAGAQTAPRQSIGEAITEARRHRGYVLLTTAFFVCGFQVTFITVHFVPFIADAGLGAAVGATALALIGLGNVFGTMIWGALGGRYLKKLMLALIYLLRSLAIAVFLILPVTETSVIVFASVMGFLWLGTVPLTSSLIGTFFGVRYISTLYGIVFMSHQLGSFCGTYLGGVIYQRMGSYDLVWYMSITLGIVAALLHWPIDERHPRLARQAA
jgi:predicted MFS family arabinose efflux permease